MLSSSHIGQLVSFDLHPVNIIRDRFEGVEILGVFGFDIARQLSDVASMHYNVYNTLPQNTPNDPSAYNYVQVRFPNGTTTVLGLPWINESSISLEQAVTYQIDVFDCTIADREELARMLTANGRNRFAIRKL